jgi:uncharacterized membrane protein YhaH (DUF805 family)
VSVVNSFIGRYFSFGGRLARLPFFVRCIYVNIAAMLLLAVGLALLSHGGSASWFAGAVFATASFVLLIAGLASATVRRLHDLGLAGYHVIWVGAAEAAWTFLSEGPLQVVVLSFPLAVIGLWLTFWPGNRGANRFGEA